jgi:bacterioferritin
MSSDVRSQKVIDLLNEARAREITAIMTYMAYHYVLEDQDYGKLAKAFKKIGIEEMKHGEECAERILFLNGVPTTKPDGKIQKTDKIDKMLEVSEALEQQACDMYNAAANECAKEGDQISKKIFEELLAEEEEHLDYFQNQQELIKQLGTAYLATLVGEGE